MISNFMYKFWLILLATTVINNFGMDSKKTFGCHNLESVNLMVYMEGNEMFGNLMQCMRNTGTYTKENLDIAKKFQNDFKVAEKASWGDTLKREGLGLLYFFIPAGICGAFFASTLLYKDEKYAVGAITSLVFAYTMNKIGDKPLERQILHEYAQERERKKPIAMDIKNFVDTLQKKGK